MLVTYSDEAAGTGLGDWLVLTLKLYFPFGSIPRTRMPGLECSNVSWNLFQEGPMSLATIVSAKSIVGEQSRTLERHYVIAHFVAGRTVAELIVGSDVAFLN